MVAGSGIIQKTSEAICDPRRLGSVTIQPFMSGAQHPVGTTPGHSLGWSLGSAVFHGPCLVGVLSHMPKRFDGDD